MTSPPKKRRRLASTPREFAALPERNLSTTSASGKRNRKSEVDGDY